MFRVKMLPAAFGDALFVEYGDDRNPVRLLIDGGTGSTLPALTDCLAVSGSPCPLALLVVTHIDRDHIEGIVKLLSSAAGYIRPADVWFNGFNHLTPDLLGRKDGEELSRQITRLKWPWNAAFKGQSVVVPSKGSLPVVPLPDGATLTLLSPTWPKLEDLRKEWAKEAKKAGILDPGAPAEGDDMLGRKRPPPVSLDVKRLAAERTTPDDAEANGSSIAFILEHGGKRCLFGADAHPDVLLDALERYSPDKPVELTAFKVPHHGSRANVSNELLGKIHARRYLFSTNSAQFGHPDPECIARILSSRPRKNGKPDAVELVFNYRTPYTTPWENDELAKDHGYTTLFSGAAEGGVTVEL